MVWRYDGYVPFLKIWHSLLLLFLRKQVIRTDGRTTKAKPLDS